MEATALEAESLLGKSLTRDEALRNAILAAELYMKATKLASSDHERARLRDKCKQLLSRAEDIKKSANWTPVASHKTVLNAPSSRRAITRREEVILLEGSKLHGFIFPPWTSDPEDSIFEEKTDAEWLYKDPADLKLSDAQREIFAGWRRPNETFGGIPKEPGSDGDYEQVSMVADKDIDLVQDITTDCSVVASLCAVTTRAMKGHGKLLVSMVYPYDKLRGRPRISKNGKYIFRLHFNGCFRKVTIDDRLPASNSSRKLHVIDRNNHQLLWPALIEKAYLKVRGGYDFPGSNSGTDLWVLTGWIPEQVFLQSDDLQPEQLWRQIHKSFGFGDVMITLGTGKLSHNEEKEVGLAGQHDYAVLDMKEHGTQRLLLVKNPWCDGMVWKGSSLLATEEDSSEKWTDELRDALPEEPIQASAPGTFWMSFEEVVQNFESLYLNWNPGLFVHRQDHHFSWTVPLITNPGSFTHNPQYAVTSANGGTVWVLLSRHFATAEQAIVKHGPGTLADASSALGFISLYIFEANGYRVCLSDDAFHRGAYVDSPQTLARLQTSPSNSYTVVVAEQALKLPKYSFTLSFFSRSPLTVTTAIDELPHCTSHSGAWTIRTAGGNASAASYPSNPQYSISVPTAADISLLVETDKPELAVHVKMVWATDGRPRISTVTARDIIGSSGDYRRGCALASLHAVPPGNYTIVCSTFEAGQTANFTLRVGSTVPCAVKPVLAETAGRLTLQLPVLVFQSGVDRMLAPLTASRMTRLQVVARSIGGDSTTPSHSTTSSSNTTTSIRTSGTSTPPPPSLTPRSRPLLKLSLELGQGPNKTILDKSSQDGFSDAPMGIRTSSDVDFNPAVMGRRGGLWIVLERLEGRVGKADEVEVQVLSDGPVTVGVWGTGDG